ncbi:MAG: arginine deiminase [Phycisphaerales bacterium]|nr:arginine deiminase [Phycisphaerales bacterium]MCB9854344.1 arginine deiminase [Phycisphaerales bacterium]MCB9863545.1 arginine deiminase [Phycisphaerales bacterium]
MKFNIINEYDPLECVMVHRPGDEIERLTHNNMERFLFEDIPFLKRMQEEHDEFCDAMRSRGISVFYLEKMLLELLGTHAAAKQSLIETVCRVEGVPAIAQELLNTQHFPDESLLQLLFAGLTTSEYQKKTGRRSPPSPAKEDYILEPIPNAYFSRDPAVVVGPTVISCKMHYFERVRETILTRSVLEHHPEFAGQTITYGGSRSPTEDRPFTIEGGDVIVLSRDALLIGASERTRSETIEVLAKKAFDEGHVKRVYEIPIPTERTFMHLDTVLTIVDHGVVVWFPGVMEHIKYIHHLEEDDSGQVVRKKDSRNLEQILSDEFGKQVEIVRTGGGDEHFASREQRTDGTNTLALAPRVACTYERNTRTIAAMEKAGIECISIIGSELVRGLGGPRCMTMPLRRRSADEATV